MIAAILSLHPRAQLQLGLALFACAQLQACTSSVEASGHPGRETASQVLEASTKLAALELAYQEGSLRDNDLIWLAQLRMLNGKSEDAAHLLSRHLADGTIENRSEVFALLAQARLGTGDWKQAARATLKAAAAAASEPDVTGLSSGELYLVAARMYVNQRDWVEARKAVVSAKEQGLRDTSDADRLLEMIDFQQRLTKVRQGEDPSTGNDGCRQCMMEHS